MRDRHLFLEQALIEAGQVTPAQLEMARVHAARHELDLVDALVQTNALPGRDLALIRADVAEVPFVDLDHVEASYANTRLLPRTFAERYDAFALFVIDGVLTLAMDDPLNLEATDQARQITRCEVDAVQCERSRLRALIGRAYSLGRFEDEAPLVAAPSGDSGDDSSQPAVTAVNQMLADAIESGASDVHVNPDEHALHLRYRIDGVLQERQGPPLSVHAAIAQRLKVMARLDLTQTKRPQDGKFRFTHAGADVDVRLSTIPTVCGENIVMRLLRRTQGIHDFLQLGVPNAVAARLETVLQQPYGILLVTGPTGSGKTTTLYTALSKLNDPSRNIMTIENPVEIRLPYLRQVQTHEEIGLTFAAALRSILRQDPDVVLVGEIRDAETAKIATQASLTGHMVLSTLHTNDAAGAVDRLRDFGIPPFVINSALLAVVAQRLVRRVCAGCVQPDPLDDITRHRFRRFLDPAAAFVRGIGCARCGRTGFKGRTGLYEVLVVSPRIRAVIDAGGTVDQIRLAAIDEGMRQLWEDGLDKARLGQTTLGEVGRIASVLALDAADEGEERRSA